jgi:DNA-binding MarR family transcriptional regulator
MAARIGDREVIGNLTVILIAHLYLHGSRRPVEIQEITGLSSGGVTKLLDRMEGLGLIARAHGQVSADRRAITVDLTDDGTRMARLLAAGLMDRISDVRMTLRELAGAADGVAERADAGRRSVAAEPGPGRTGPATARRSRNSNDRSGSR